MNAYPLVSLLVLNWNGEEVLPDCLHSILSATYPNYEIIVVDNASTDNSMKILNDFPSVKVVVNPQNYGFARGNNIGFSHCNGKYIVTLNNDIIVEPDWLVEPILHLEKEKSLGIVSCRQMNYFHRDVIDQLYSYPTSHLLLGRMGFGKKYEDKNKQFSEPGYTIGASGASVIYRKQLLSQLNGFEESFFAYHEECDLHMRAFYAGWKCLYIPSSVVHHKGSYSFKKVKKAFYFYHERNRIWFIYRNFPLSVILEKLPVLLFREMRTFLNIVVKNGHLSTYLKARVEGFKGMLHFKGERKKNMYLYSYHKKELREFFKHRIISLKK